MIKEGDYLTGNERFEGFCVDLIHEICNRLRCKYEYRLVGDDSYGKRHENGTWNGMVGEVINRVSKEYYLEYYIFYFFK